MPYSTTPVLVTKNDTLQFRYTAPNDWNTTETVNIKIGKTAATWTLVTVAEDIRPDQFFFIDVDNAELSTTYTYADGSRISEQVVTVAGLSAGTEVGVSFSLNVTNFTDVDGAVEITKLNGTGAGVWFKPASVTGTRVANGDKVRIRIKSSALYDRKITATLSLGNTVGRWSVTTQLRLRNMPNPFPSFGDMTGQPLNTYIYSNVVQILGLSSSPASTQVLGSDSFVGISSSNATTTDSNGFEVLSGATFYLGSLGPTNIINGQYMQLKARSGTNLGSIGSFGFSVGEGSTSNGDGTAWQVSTATRAVDLPTNFSFVSKSNQPINSLIESAPAPAATITNPNGGISGLGVAGAQVTLVSTTSSEVKIKINDGSIGIFPANVKNGDFITLYAKSSSSISTDVEVRIKVGGATITPWIVGTSSGPDTTPDPLIKPSDLIGVVPNTDQTSGTVFITGINSPVDINASGALISIDYDNPVAGTRQFDPGTNTSFRVILKSSTGLGAQTSTNVTVGTNGVFTWSVTTYASVPVGITYKSAWYSKKNEQRSPSGGISKAAKYDGYSVGTIIPVLKQSPSDYGIKLTSGGGEDPRFPGFLYCDGKELNVVDYLELFLTIGNTYGGTGNYTLGTPTVPAIASGTFKLPNYKNRRMCGTGVVDGNNASSVFLNVTGGAGGSGTYNTVGQEGGYWYVDKVSTNPALPFEQATGPTTSSFFTLGTVKTTGAELVTTDDVEFIPDSGLISGTVGPISTAAVGTPEHEHYYISAITESDGDEGFVKYKQNNAFGAFPAIQNLIGGYATPGGTQAESEKINLAQAQSASTVTALFKTWMTNRQGTATGLARFLGQQTGDIKTLQQLAERPIVLNQTEDIQFLNWWPSPPGQLPAESTDPLYLRRVGGEPTMQAAMIDTEEDTFKVDRFQNTEQTSPAKHSHFLSPVRILDPNTDFSYDDVTGSGGPGALRVGLGDGVAVGSPGRPETTLQITFNHNDVQMGFNEGTFELNKTVKTPKPSYRIEPQSTVPVITEFHKVRYMIKAH